jgi:hypothetical protein
VTESTSQTYKGAVVMNGKAIYEDDDISTSSYHGHDNVKTVKFIYTPNGNSCLNGKQYSMVIVLTKDN